MSSATGSQNLLTNVFRPVYRYEIPMGGSAAVFTPKLDICNIDVLSANSISGFTAAIGDENENVYVGSNAGNEYSNLRGCSNVTAVGFAAASLVSNVTNSVYIGYNSGAGAADSSVNVAIGPNTKGNGISNIYIGSNTGSLGTGSNNILIGHNLTGTNLSNTLLIGPTPTIYGNLSTRKVGIGRDPSYNMDISGDSRISYRLGVGMAPGSAVGLSNLPHALDVSGYTYINGALGINADPADYTMNVNGRFNVDDGNGSLRLTSDGSGNSVIEARPRTGKKLIFNIQGDLCATAIIIPGASYTGNVTASNLIASNDLSGPMAHVTNIYGNTVYGTDVSGATARFGTLYASTFNPAAISVAVLTAGNGSVSTPSLTFSGDASAGLYLPSASNVAFTTAGVERMRISNAFVGIGTNVPRSALDVSTNIRAGTPGNTTNTARLEVGGGYDSTGTAVTNSYPTLAFQYGDSAGGYRHFVRTRHTAVTGDTGNGIDIFTNNSTTAAGSTAPGTSNLLGLSITSAGVGVGMSNPGVALDVSGGIRSTTAAISAIGGVILSNNNISNTTGTTRSSNFIGTGSASNNIGGITLNNTTLASVTMRNAEINWTTDISGGIVDTSSAIVANFLRNARTATLFDISGGNISNSGTHVATTFRNAASNWTTDVSGGIVDTSSAIVANFLRNARTATLFDISGGNISNSGTHVATTFRNAASNWTTDISGGITDTSSAIVANFLRNARTATLFDISGGNISNSATHTTSNLLSSNGYIRTTFAGSIISDISLGNARLTGSLIVSNGINAPGSNVFGGTTLNGNIVILPGAYFNSNILLGSGLAAIRDNDAGFTYDISEGRFRGVAGSVSNPTYAFLAEPSAGLYRPGVGQVAVAVGGVQRLVVSNSNVGIGRVLPSATLDVSGDVSANGFLASAYIRNAIIPTNLDISGGNISNSGTHIATTFRNAAVSWSNDISQGNFRSGLGAVSNPAYAFVADPSAGLYRPGAGQLGITTAGIPRILLDGSSTKIGWPASATQSTAILEVGGGYVSGGAQAGRSLPAIAFQYGDPSTGGFRHFVRSRHNAAANNTGNAIDFFLNDTTTAEGSSGPGTNNRLGMTVTAAGVGIGTSAPITALDVCGDLQVTYSTGLAAAWIGARSNALLLYGESNNVAYIRNFGLNKGLYIGAGNSNDNTMFVSNTRVGILTGAPAYTLDISASPGTAASINMNTWPRIASSNVTIVNGLASTALVGYTVNFNAATITMSTTMSTWVSSDATVGSSFRPLISGIWSINVNGFVAANGHYAWIDGSTNNTAAAASNGHNVIGNQYLAFAQPNGQALSLNFTGYLSASNYYKIKASSSPVSTSGFWSAVFTFLGETSTTTDYPYKRS